MKIALDWDGTYTLDPAFWRKFIDFALAQGHDIRIVTLRRRSMTDAPLQEMSYLIPVVFTEMAQKREFCDKIDWHPDIWIDDSPEFIVRKDVLNFIEVFKGDSTCEEGDQKAKAGVSKGT